jgi:hypothetical protein
MSKTLSTKRAVERLLARVTAHVNVQVIGSAEHLPTNITRECFFGFFALVRLQMALQAGRLIELLHAHNACEWLVACVCSYVALQV